MNLFIGLIILELILVTQLVVVIQRISAQRASLIFIFYSILNGVTLSSIFLFVLKNHWPAPFGISRNIWCHKFIRLFYKNRFDKNGQCAFYGLNRINYRNSCKSVFKKRDALLDYNLFESVDFVGLTASDTQKIKRIGALTNSASEGGKKASILGALTLYLDFINMFLFLLKIFGKRN